MHSRAPRLRSPHRIRLRGRPLHDAVPDFRAPGRVVLGHWARQAFRHVPASAPKILVPLEYLLLRHCRLVDRNGHHTDAVPIPAMPAVQRILAA